MWAQHGRTPAPPPPQIITVEVPVIQERVVAGPEVIHQVPVFIERTVTEILEVEVPVPEIRECGAVGISAVLTVGEQLRAFDEAGLVLCASLE